MIDMDRARSALAAFQSLLDHTPPERAHVRINPDAWTLTEIVGHLIDSAANNHQRFARLRLGNLENFPGYDAEPWVHAQAYDACSFEALTRLWTVYNELLLHLAWTTPEAALGNNWICHDGPKTLELLVNDYYRHLLLHVDQYETRLGEVEAMLQG